MAVAVFLIVSALVGGLLLFDGFTRTDGGQIAVIRNGGPLDNRQFRQVVAPGSSLTWTGMFSQTHPYPGSQRFYTISANPKMADSGGVDVETVPTSDGVEIGLEATMYFDLNQDPAVLKPFDNKYGTRTYRDKTGEYHEAWDGDLGWSTFLDAVIRPVISNDLRQEVGNYRCVDLQASCALVQNNGLKPAQVAEVVKGGGTVNNTNIARIQEAINKSLKEDFESTLAGHTSPMWSSGSRRWRCRTSCSWPSRTRRPSSRRSPRLRRRSRRPPLRRRPTANARRGTRTARPARRSTC
jgi:hypothetical protein